MGAVGEGFLLWGTSRFSPLQGMRSISLSAGKISSPQQAICGQICSPISPCGLFIDSTLVGWVALVVCQKWNKPNEKHTTAIGLHLKVCLLKRLKTDCQCPQAWVPAYTGVTVMGHFRLEFMASLRLKCRNVYSVHLMHIVSSSNCCLTVYISVYISLKFRYQGGLHVSWNYHSK